MKKTTFKCSDCGGVKPVQTSGGTGYGYFGKSKRKVCYACCAERDKKDMAKTGKAMLYLTHNKNGTQHGNFAVGCEPPSEKRVWEISNWPGSLKFSAFVRVGSHNIARRRYDAWFTDHTGRQWHGVTIGDNTQICHCKRLA
jgi:hypothetical protein